MISIDMKENIKLLYLNKNIQLTYLMLAILYLVPSIGVIIIFINTVMVFADISFWLLYYQARKFELKLIEKKLKQLKYKASKS